MLESYFLVRQMTGCTTKAGGMPSLSAKVVSWEITHPKSLDMSYAFKGLSRGKGEHVSGMRARDQDREEGVTGEGGLERDTRGKGVLGSHRHLSAKRGACEGKAEAAIPALGWYHVKLSASSLFLLRGFVSHANSGSGPNSPGQALHPNWQGWERKGGGLEWEEGGYLGIAWGGRSVGMSRMPVLLGHWCHACAHRGRAAEGPRRPFLPPPTTLPPTLHSLFFQDEWIFQKRRPLCPIIDSDYPDFMLPSQCEEVPRVLALRANAMQQGPRGVVLATLCGLVRGGWRGGKRKLMPHTHTHPAHTPQ